MKPALKRRSKRSESDESDEDAPLVPANHHSSGGSEDEADNKKSPKRANVKNTSESESDYSDNESETKRKNDKRGSPKKPKYNDSEPENPGKDASNESEGEEDRKPVKSSKKGKTTKSTKDKKSKKGKRGRPSKQKKASHDDVTNGNSAVDDTDYEVESILDQRMKFGKLQYLIRWKGYGPQYDTWERAGGLQCPDVVKQYKQRAKEHQKDESSDDEKTEEFEVSRILEVHFRRDGSREFLVGWKGYGMKDNTWEHETNMKCPELIAQFMRRVDVAKQVTPRELREHRKPAKYYTSNSFNVSGRRLSGRSKDKPRVNYFYDDQY